LQGGYCRVRNGERWIRKTVINGAQKPISVTLISNHPSSL
jgi:hypothetical protein